MEKDGRVPFQEVGFLQKDYVNFWGFVGLKGFLSLYWGVQPLRVVGDYTEWMSGCYVTGHGASRLGNYPYHGHSP